MPTDKRTVLENNGLGLLLSPNKKISIAIAGVLGFILGSVITILMEFSDNIYKNKVKRYNSGTR